MAADPITVEVLRSALPAIADEMSYVLKRTSYNMMIFEVGDYSAPSSTKRATSSRRMAAASATSSPIWASSSATA